jgi:hypothetical protein
VTAKIRSNSGDLEAIMQVFIIASPTLACNGQVELYANHFQSHVAHTFMLS